jgi:hypothetical protein
MPKNTPLDQSAIRRMMGAIAKQNGGKIPENSYVRKLQSRFDKREAQKKLGS